MTRLAYLDASALVKLIAEEAETVALTRFVESADRVITSRVGLVETWRAARRRREVAPALVDAVLASVGTVELSDAIGRLAARVGPPTLRTLDAIHLASALEFGSDLDALVSYDRRLADAAQTLGLPVVSPA